MRVLLVDDDEALREALSEVLDAEGHEVATARDGADALSRLRAGPRPDAILLDLMMPVMNGWEFLQHHRADPTLAAIPVVVVTAMGTVSRPAPAFAVLHKPFRIDELAAVLARIGERGAAEA